MKSRKILWSGGLFAAMLLLMPLTSNAAADTNNEQWNQGQAELEKNLPPGLAKQEYKTKIEQLGYKITSTNYNDDDYLEYEVVKGNQTWEVQVDVDEDTNKATEVEVETNMWKTEATERALGGKVTTVETRRRNPYSDRDRLSTSQLIKELEAMPLEKDKEFYKEALAKKGYQITRTNTDDADMLSLEAVKDAHSVELNVAFNEETGKSTSIDADSMWFESDSTTRERKQQEGRVSKQDKR